MFMQSPRRTVTIDVPATAMLDPECSPHGMSPKGAAFLTKLEECIVRSELHFQRKREWLIANGYINVNGERLKTDLPYDMRPELLNETGSA
jgi:hypothetical protein